jgi:hypothetical protein
MYAAIINPNAPIIATNNEIWPFFMDVTPLEATGYHWYLLTIHHNCSAISIETNVLLSII